jgi:hypothetical protein
VRLAKDYSLLRQVTEATAWSVRLFAEQRRVVPVTVMATAFGVFEWRQIAHFDGFFRFFL